MTTAELHEILEDKNRKLTIEELKEIVYELKNDCWNEAGMHYEEDWLRLHYSGEANFL